MGHGNKMNPAALRCELKFFSDPWRRTLQESNDAFFVVLNGNTHLGQAFTQQRRVFKAATPEISHTALTVHAFKQPHFEYSAWLNTSAKGTKLAKATWTVAYDLTRDHDSKCFMVTDGNSLHDRDAISGN